MSFEEVNSADHTNIIGKNTDSLKGNRHSKHSLDIFIHTSVTKIDTFLLCTETISTEHTLCRCGNKHSQL